MKKFRYVSIVQVFVLLIVGFLFTFNIKSQSIKSTDAIKSAPAAVNRALQYTGFSMLKDFELPKDAVDIAALVVAKDSTTPFLSDSIDGRSAWRVEFKDIVLREGAHQKTFDVLIDAETGRLLEIRSKYEGPPEKRPCEPLENVATQQLGMTIEKYYGFPTDLPAVCFIEALNMAWGSPLHATLIVAHYVIYSSQRGESRPAWAINLHGLPPIPVKNGTIDFMRSVRDAQTGQKMGSVNLPYMPCDDPDWHWPGVDTLKVKKKDE